MIAMAASIGCGMPSIAFADDAVDAVVKGLTEYPPDSAEAKAAREKAKTLTADQAAAAAEAIKNRIVNDATQAATAMLNLYEIANKAGPNPALKALGEKLAEALKGQLKNLDSVLKDAETTGGKLQIRKALLDMGITDVNEQLDRIEKLEKAARERRQKQEQASVSARSVSVASLHFNAAQQTLSLTNDTVVSLQAMNGSQSTGDAIIGSSVILPELVYSGINPEGSAGFRNLTTAPIQIMKGGQLFMTGSLVNLIYDQGMLQGYISDLQLAGAPAGSLFEGLPDAGSLFTVDTANFMGGGDLTYAMMLYITPGADLLSLTNGFTMDGTTTFDNLIAVTVPEPGSLVLLCCALGLACPRRRCRTA